MIKSYADTDVTNIEEKKVGEIIQQKLMNGLLQNNLDVIFELLK